MRIFNAMYNKTLQWSRHRLASYWLMFVSFIEAIFFPIPTDVMLIPMSITTPEKAIRYALYASTSSVIGGAIGYALGYYALDLIQPYITQLGYQASWDTATSWFEKWGVLVIFVAGFSPIPYKVFTLCAGAMQMAFLPFILVGWISRTARYLLVAKLSAWGGERFSNSLSKYIEMIGWGVVILAIIVYFIFK